MYYLCGLARCLLAFVYGLMQIRVTRGGVLQGARARTEVRRASTIGKFMSSNVVLRLHLILTCC